MRAALIAAIVCFALPAAAEPPVIKDTFGFDWLKPKTSKCTKVTGALLTKLTKSYTCKGSDGTRDSASGKPIVATCTAKQGKSEFLLLATAKDCNTERETQLANGE